MHKKFSTILIIFIALVLAGFLHGYNMFHYPYYEEDEGVYFSQAYAVAYQGKLANYTYWYDHAPMGWIIVALWMLLTGGPFTFGYSLFSARIFMLIIHLLTSILIYVITKRLTGKNWPAFMAVIMFSLTPLGVYFQRRLLLDNIMTFWILTTCALLIFAKQRISWIIGAGISFAIAALSKETAIVTIPAFWLMTFFFLQKKQRVIGVVAFSMPIILGGLYFLLYAFLKNELFPGPNHVSLIGTWAYQLSRGQGQLFWSSNSLFYVSFVDWLGKDSWFLIISLLATLWLILGRKKSFIERSLGMMAVCLWLFLTRGLVINFYIVPLIALGAIAIAILLADIARLKIIGLIIITTGLSIWISKFDYAPWLIDEASPGIESINWIKANLPPKSVVAGNYAQLLDIQKSRFPGDPAFVHTHWFYKFQLDPQIQSGEAGNDWQNLNYIIYNHELIHQIHEGSLPFLAPTVGHSYEIASWGPLSSRTYVDIDQKISTNGDWIKVYKMFDRTDVVLSDAWHYYLKNFVSSEGQVTDPETNLTTSEGQSYAMLRSVIVGDKKTFDSVWNWTASHLQFRNEDKLFSWKWLGDSKTGRVVDTASATDADIDIATALISAGEKWNDLRLINSGKVIIKDIWRQQVIKLGNGHYYLLAGSWAGYGDSLTVNPSYLSPASFRLFEKYDNINNWTALANDSYYFLNLISSKNSSGLSPDWIGVNKKNGDLITPKDNNLSSNFSYDAMRVYFRVAQDAIWFNSQEAIDYLKNRKFLISYWKENNKIPTSFSPTGTVLAEQESNAFYGAFLPYFKVVDENLYTDLKAKLQNDYSAEGYWNIRDNYFTQNWAWFGISLAEGKYKYENSF